MLLRRMTLCTMLLAGLPGVSHAQGIKVLAPANPGAAEQDIQPERIPLAIVPAAEPRPALRYHLLPPAKDRQPGNAVAFYYRAIHACVDLEQRRDSDRNIGQRNVDLYQRLVESPIHQFPVEEARTYLTPYKFALSELRTAAYREECDWGWHLEKIQGPASIEFLLAEVQDARRIARVLALKTRLEIAEGRFEDALDTLRCGYQLARDITKPPLLINALVGIAISVILDEQLHTLMQQPDSPNLYWALTERPTPLIDIREAIEYELGFPERVFPFLKDAETANRTPEQWADALVDSFRQLTEISDNRTNSKQSPANLTSRVAVMTLAMARYPKAKEHLIAAGYDVKKVEAMSVGQVIAIDEKYLCEYAADELRKNMLVFEPGAIRRMQETENRLKEEGFLVPGLRGIEVIPILSTLFPATSAACNAVYRREATTAGLRVIEAIRMHAAITGKLPESLDDIKVVPVPLNPRFGKPFPYKLDGNTATLEVRRNTEEWQPHDRVDRIYEITIQTETK